MPRFARRASSTSLYHAINRGAGYQIIFEDDDDRRFFMRRLIDYSSEERVRIHAWCLMDNHFHLLLEAPFETLGTLMHRLETSYAQYFNRVHGRVGPVFDQRFKSEPIETEEYLMTVVRYIHENPTKAGLGPASDYSWSSFQEYCNGAQYIDTSFILGVFGGIELFVAFHDRPHEEEACLEIGKRPRRALTDVDAKRMADDILGEDMVLSIYTLGRAARDLAIQQLRASGLGVRQIQRLTGLSLGVISRAAHGAC